MYPHHIESIDRMVEYYSALPEVRAILLGGSIAHGFETPSSDIDITLVVTPEAYAARQANGAVHFVNRDGICHYEGGYVDGKYVDIPFIELVSRRGSEPSRFAFKNGRVLFSLIDGMDDLVAAAAQYPIEGKVDRLRRFYAQFEAWYWFIKEALKRQDAYLLGTAISRFTLFSGRLILTHNEMLYPYHKWIMRVLESAPERPADLMEHIAALHKEPGEETAQRLYLSVKDFREWEQPPAGWPSQFSLDSELNWLDASPPIDDL